MVDIERIVHIIACIYGQRAEAVINIGLDECYLFLGINCSQLRVSYEEIICLRDNEIIEFDCGNNEPGFETEVYRLTEEAQERIRVILKNKKMLQLKE